MPFFLGPLHITGESLESTKNAIDTTGRLPFSSANTGTQPFEEAETRLLSRPMILGTLGPHKSMSNIPTCPSYCKQNTMIP